MLAEPLKLFKTVFYDLNEKTETFYAHGVLLNNYSPKTQTKDLWFVS